MCRKKILVGAGSTLKHVDLVGPGMKPVPSFMENMESHLLERQESPHFDFEKFMLYLGDSSISMHKKVSMFAMTECVHNNIFY